MSKAHEARVPQVAVWGPFKKFKLRHEQRSQPSALFHLLRGEPLPPPPASGFRKVRERTLIGLQRSELLEQLRPR